METVREYLKRRARRMKVVIYVGLGIVVLTNVLYHERMAGLQFYARTIGATLVVAAVAYLTSGMYRFRCPQCGKGLRNIRPRARSTELGHALMSPEGIGACPHCGASFDVPMPP